MAAPYRSYRIELWALIGYEEDQFRVSLIGFNAEWNINGIPQANLLLAVGRDSENISLPSSIHTELEQLQYKTPVEVWANIELVNQSLVGAGKTNQDDLPTGDFLLFEGYSAYQGYNKAVGAAGFTLTVEHWLAGLTFTSAVSGISHPQNPLDLLFPSTVRLINPDAGIGQAATGGLTGQGMAASAIGADVTEDLWGNGILKWYDLLAAKDHLLDASLGSQLQLVLGLDGKDRRPNQWAQEVLNRMRAKSEQPKLQFDLSTGAGQTIAANIRREIASKTLDGELAGQTLWDNLAELSGRYLFAIVPTFSTALVVPWNPALRTSYKTIYANEYYSIERSASSPLLLRGLAMYGSFSFDSGGNAGESEAFKDIGIGGTYMLPATQGVVKIVPAPSWLAGVTFQGYARITAGPGVLVRNTGEAPVAGAPAPTEEIKGVLEGMKTTLDKFARAAYHNEALAFRTATITGKLRTDVAPGSVMKIQLTPEKFLAEDDLGKTMYGAVASVAININSETSQAFTSFRLVHLRSEEENKSDRFTATNHPLYKTIWKGERLDL